ncbi:GH25 family lysozyme [Bacillus songklensis]|uniref:Lysozyme n=1 Tax=Bacillus songklensis TaxID=1069116 RepID=A0ABV8B599_9BACI
MQARSATNYKVIDVSHHNGNIEWRKVALDGVRGVYIKATEGRTYTDPKFLINYKSAKSAGLRVGFYHFARPDNNRPADEVNHFINVTQSLEADLPYSLDLEVAADLGADRLTDFAYEWLMGLVNKTGHPVMIYASAGYARSYLKSKLGQFPLWVAHYTTERTPMANHTWDQWHMFQYTSSGKVNGISGNVDINEAIPELFELVSKPVTQVEAAFIGQSVYKLGDKSDGVKQIQQKLMELGYELNGGADGNFGSFTLKAVMHFQFKHDLIADGLVGPATIFKLNEEAGRLDSTKNAKKYRLRTGTFSDRATAERMAAELKQRYGWLVYIDEE